MRISNIHIYHSASWIIENADVSWSAHQEKVYIAVPTEYEDFICQANADAFLIGFVQIAAKYDEDIIIETRPVSSELVSNIETKLIPAFHQMGCGSKPIHVVADCYTECLHGRNGATGISLGVDSLYSILTNVPQRVNTVVNVIETNGFDSMLLDVSNYDYKNNRKQNMARAINCCYIPVLTNAAFVLGKEFNYTQTHTFFHLFTAMILMNHIDTYYYSTGYADKDFCLNFSDSSHYDVLTSQVVTYGNFQMITSGGDVTRVQKTSYLANSVVANRCLDVCLKNGLELQNGLINCSVCAKCRRTMVTLDTLGKLENFSEVFDVDYYKAHKPWYVGEILYSAIIMHDLLAVEILNEMKRVHYRIPFRAWWFFFKRGIINQMRKIKRLVK